MSNKHVMSPGEATWWKSTRLIKNSGRGEKIGSGFDRRPGSK